MGVLEDIQKSLGGSTAAGKKKTPTDAEKLELEGTENWSLKQRLSFLRLFKSLLISLVSF